jgi:hypothetical protein
VFEVVFTGNVNNDVSNVVPSPHITDFVWVALTSEIDIETFVAKSEFFAYFINWIDWGAET